MNIQPQSIKVADFSLAFTDRNIESGMPTGEQLAAAAGFKPKQQVTVLHVLSNGELEDIRPDEVVDLGQSTCKFIIGESDRNYRLTFDKTRFDWPLRIISGVQLRKLGQVSREKQIYLELPDGVERVIHDHDLVDLDAAGVEEFKTRKQTWKLNVQGVVLTIHHPTIEVKQAIQDAGFDPKKDWIIVLRVKGEPRREVGSDFVVDLRTPGIEKIRLTPRNVDNGEAPSAPRREFDLLDKDVHFLDGLNLRWETVLDGVGQQQRRWLLIHGYQVPGGFTEKATLLALEIPKTYPMAQIDMFYTSPPLALTSGRAIPSTQVSAVIKGVHFNGWSRHRGNQNQWNPETDNVSTHLALVESAMAKEAGE